MAKRFFAGLGTGYIVLIANAVMMIILMPFFLSHLGEEMTGIYIMVAGLANVINYGIGWLAETSSVVLSSRSQANKKNYLLRPIYRFQQLLFGTYGLFICAILLIAGYLLPHFWNASSPENLRDVQISLYLFGINYVVYLLHNGDQSFLFSQLRINTSNGLRILYQLVFFGLTILFLQLHPHLYSVFLAQLVTTILLSFASLLILKQYQLNWWQWARPRRILWRAILMRTGGPIAGFAALWGIMMYADTVLVGFLLGPAAAAQYFAGTKIAETIALLIMRISEMAHPYFARTQKNAQHRKILYLQLNRLLLFLTLAAAIGYAYFGEMVMHVWLGDNAPELPPELFWLAGIAIIFRVAIKFEYNVVISLQA
nr:oligosaccharide flippase family protein [Alphaproteobacteria bacterium]